MHVHDTTDKSSPEVEHIKKKSSQSISARKDFVPHKKIVQKRRFYVLSAIVSILLGMLAGSIFVDVAQFVSREGISPRALRSTEIFEYSNRTWVAYEEPIVKVTVITDSHCLKCTPDESLFFLRRFLPTMQANIIEDNSPMGEQLLRSTDAITLPTFVFDDNLEQTLFYFQAQELFEKKSDQHILNPFYASDIGVTVGKYIQSPEIGEGDIQIGEKSLDGKVVFFIDFASGHSQIMYPAINKITREYSDRVHFAYVPLLDEMNPQSSGAALASYCAYEQGKFDAYAATLFARQEEWLGVEDSAKLKRYSTLLDMDAKQFGECLDTRRYDEQIQKNIAKAEDFGIGVVPATFFGSEHITGVQDYETMRDLIESNLLDT